MSVAGWQLQARKKGEIWIDIYPAQLEAMSKYLEVRALEIVSSPDPRTTSLQSLQDPDRDELAGKFDIEAMKIAKGE